MSPEGKVHVVVRSRRVPVASVVRTEPVYSTSGLLIGFKPSRLVLFEKKLDVDNQRAVDEAKKLARSLGVGLEVVERSGWGVFGRLISRMGLGDSRSPSVLVFPPTLLAVDPSLAVSPNC